MLLINEWRQESTENSNKELVTLFKSVQALKILEMDTTGVTYEYVNRITNDHVAGLSQNDIPKVQSR